MKSIHFALLFLFLAPGTALAAETTMVARDLPRGVNKAPTQFDLVGLHWKGSGSVSFRTRRVAGQWSSWRDAAPEDDGPDAGNHELRVQGWHLGSPYWTGASDRIEVRTFGRVTRVRAHYLRSPVRARRDRATSIAGSPLIFSRRSWVANERIRRGKPSYADSLRFALVHHTAGSNSYTRAQSASIVRGIQRYHVLANGWDDIGYNFLVDKYGQVFQGRYGGNERNVVGAHAQGFNTGSTGIALIGTYEGNTPSPAARAALTRLLAWRLDVAHVDPLSTFGWRSSGNPRFPAGRNVTLRTISGHRDTGYTSCPGSRLYGELPALTESVAETGLPKIYFPVVTGAPGQFVHFTATLTDPVPWSVIVTQPDGNVVATGQGMGPDVDWTWDARTVPDGRYRYTIDAGPTARPATGAVAGTSSTQASVTALARPALISPNGDRRGDSTVIRYRLREASLVTASVVDSAGTPVTTLFVEQRSAGSHEFPWDAFGLADGRYGIALTARNALGIESTATAAVVVDRTLVGLRVAPQVFSPNGDGRLDTTRFNFVLNGPARVSLVVRKGKTTLGEVYAGQLAAGQQSIEWNGRFRRGVGEREYRATLHAASLVATTRQTVMFAVDRTGPRLRLVSSSTLTFSVNEPGDVTVVFDGNRTVTRRRFTPGRLRISSGGTFSTFRAVARDFAGNDGRAITYP